MHRHVDDGSSWTGYGTDALQIQLIDEVWVALGADQLEPLTPPQEACEPEFKAQLDELLQRHGIAA